MSSHIKEAVAEGDPSDANKGSGIKTPHINDRAVTGPKIAPNAVGKDQLADRAVNGEKLAEGAVGIAHIKDGAVTGAKIAGGTVNGGQLANGAVQPRHIAMYSNTAFVAPAGGDYTNPAVAMGDYAAWCGTPSESNRCLLRILPGVYDIGDSYVRMESYIDIHGSGIGTTKVVGSGWYVVYGSSVSNAELRALTVKNSNRAFNVVGTGVVLSSSFATLADIAVEAVDAPKVARGMYFSSGAPVLRRVSVTVSVGASADKFWGIYAKNGVSGRWTDLDVSVSSTGDEAGAYGLFNVSNGNEKLVISDSRFEVTSGYEAKGMSGRNVILEKSTFSASAPGRSCGVYISGGLSSRIYNSRIAGESSLCVASGTVDVDDSVLEGYVDAENGWAAIGGSKIVGSTSENVTCAGVYDEGYHFYAENCP
jgi:hypothetical protein